MELSVRTKKPFAGYFAREHEGKLTSGISYNPETQQGEITSRRRIPPTVCPTHSGQGEIDDERPCD